MAPPSLQQQQNADKKKFVLPPKENQQFKAIAKFYELKQYKKGIKAANMILKRFPTHGETLAMKGLLLNYCNKKEEAFELVRSGIKYDLRSHVCWHVYGMLYRSERNYTEAVKCFRNALKNDKDNTQILRDLAVLQIHLRDVEGFTESWRHLLVLKPTHQINWVGFAIGTHLSGQHKKALKILTEFESTTELENTLKLSPFDYSELLLYANMVLEESGDIKAALEHLEKIESKVVDKLTWKEKQAEFFLKLHRLTETSEAYRRLLVINPDNLAYHKGLQASLGFPMETAIDQMSEEEMKRFKELYEDLEKQFPKSDAVKRIPLSFLHGESFRTHLISYMCTRLRKGIPSLFADIKPLYRNSSAKVQCIEEVCQSFLSTLEKNPQTELEPGIVESPDFIMWIKFFMAQHYDYQGEQTLALKYIEECIAHSPTVIELYNVKGSIYKHAGDLKTAAICFDQARELDLADRFLNTKCSIYLLRTNQVEKASEIVGLFTKKGEDPMINLYDMQCCSFEQECGNSYFRVGAYGKALKKFMAIEKHFADFIDDQFDFHTYCLRKMTLRSYVEMLRFEDHIHGHRFFVEASKSIVRCYLKLYDHPMVFKDSEEESKLASMDPDEKRKYLRKKKKEEAKKAEEEKRSAEIGKAKGGDVKKPEVQTPPDPDPDGKLLVEIEDKLSAATKSFSLLQKHATKDLETQLLGCELYLKKKKYLAMLWCLIRAQKLDGNNAQLYFFKIQFFYSVIRNLQSFTSEALEVIQLHLGDLLKGLHSTMISDISVQSLVEYCFSIFEKNKSSIAHRLSLIEAILLVAPEKVAVTEQMLVKDIDSISCKGYRAMKEFEKVEDISISLSKETIQIINDSYRKRFPLSSFVFHRKSNPSEALGTDNTN